MSHDSPVLQYSLRADHLGNSIAAKKLSLVLRCTGKGADSRFREVILPCYSLGTCEATLDCWVKFWIPKNIGMTWIHWSKFSRGPWASVDLEKGWEIWGDLLLPQLHRITE